MTLSSIDNDNDNDIPQNDFHLMKYNFLTNTFIKEHFFENEYNEDHG